MADEKNFENKIKKYLDEQNCYFVKFFANRMTKVGVPDILVCANSYFVGIEVKSETGTPSELQKYNIQKVNESGGFGVIVRPSDFEMLESMITAIKYNDTHYARKFQRLINAKFF